MLHFINTSCFENILQSALFMVKINKFAGVYLHKTKIE
jgi:hypothetical protein